MKKKSQHFLLGKTATGLIAVLLLAGTVFAWNLLDSAVYAGADTVAVETVEDVAYKVESHTDINAYRQNGNFTAPTYSGEGGSEKWLFAGWYTDKECTKSLSESIVSPNAANGTYYAKYVKKEVLSVRCQLKADTKADSADTILRCVSSVDSLKYKNIGLELVTPDDSVKRMRSDKVGTKIKARDEIYLSEFTYSPKAVNTESEYFFSATERISNSDFGNGYLVKPYWITQDGTCVYGVSKYVTVNQGIRNNDGMVVDNHIYIPVQMAKQPEKGATFTANGSTATYVEYDENGGYAHLELTEVPTTSVTKYTIKDSSEQEVGTCIYRNKKIEYDGTNADTSWYNVYAEEGESKFVIESSADLYGLATIVNGGNNLKGQTVYVVSDIEANTDSTTYQWTRIGDDSHRFAGTFDGQMHSIKNIYMRLSGSNYAIQGFFGVADNNAVLKNFKLIGKPTIFVQNSGVVGSVVGKMYGATLDTVYSDAQITCNRNFVGGLIGQRANSSVDAIVKNCEFAGKVAGSASSADRGSGYGGILGVSNYRVIITDCLNTGSISILSATGSAGGLVGQAGGTTEDTKITINHCLNTGTITPVADSTENFGALVGNDASNGVMKIENSFAISGTKVVDGAETYKGVTTATKANLTGMKAITNIPELFKNHEKDGEYDYRWVVVAESTPVLKSFASETGKATMGVDTSWYDADKTEYVLKDAADLYGFALLSGETDFEGKTVKLGADITVNEGNAGEWANVAPEYDWIGIGVCGTSDFAGIFNGQGHTISGLYINTNAEDKGLFGGIATGATIQNFSLRNSYFTSTKGRIGSITGRGLGTFDTIYSDVIVEGAGRSVGGFLGQGKTGTVRMNNCWFAGSVTNTYEGAGGNNASGTGGLIGNLNNTTKAVITNCLNTGTIKAEKYEKAARVGGLIGAVLDKDTKISLCINAGQVICNLSAGYGAFAGQIDNTCADKSMFNNSYAVKEFCKDFAAGCNPKIDNTTSKLIAQADAAGINAITNMPALFQYNDGEKNYWSMTADGAPVLTSFSDMVKCETLGFNTDWYDENKSEYVLQSEADLYGFAALSKTNSFEGKTIKLANDIEVNKGDASNWAETAPAFAWNEIGTSEVWFKGAFNGQGHTIKGLYQYATAQDKGLFAGMDGDARVSNLRLTNSYFKSTKGRIGSIAGRGTGTFDTIYSDAIIVGNGDNVGGLLGQSRGTTLTLTNCWFAGSVTNESVDKQGTGGIIGNVTVPTSLTDCLNTGTVSAEAYNTKATVKDENGTETETEDILPRVGGLIGNVQENISCTVMTSLNTGEVKVSVATDAYGSVIGRAATPETVTVDRTYATQESCVKTGVDASVTTVNRSELVGANARTALADLFGENTRWTTIENGAHPVLSTFRDYAKVAENSSLLLWLRGRDSHTVTLTNPIALSTGTWDPTAIGGQGGYTDGHYFYQAYITEQAYNENGTTNDSNNKCRIIKQDLTGQEDIVISEELLLGHANDITYDSVNKRLVMYTRGNQLMFLDPDTLAQKGTKQLDKGTSFNRMAYRADHDCYVVGCPSLTNRNIPFKILNSNFETVAGPFNSNTNTFRLTGQGASCDEQYIYLLYWDKSTKIDNAIAVYDWNGNFVTSITLKTNTDAVSKEAENISVVNNTIYVMINEATKTQGRGHAEHKYVYSFTIN